MRSALPRQGAHLREGGVDFAIWSETASEVALCLFDGAKERNVVLARGEGSLHHGFVPGVGSGQRYGFRIRGPWDPGRGLRSNPQKLLVDPYAKAFDGRGDARGPLRGSGRHDDEPDAEDDAPWVPKSVVVGDAFDWGDDARPRVPWDETLLYELHVKGFTARHPAVSERERGTYLGLASDASIAHLRSIGVTTIELLPVHQAMDEAHLVRRGQTNYWGYSTLGFFAPDLRFACDPKNVVAEFKTMVRALHRAGIEVLLDVVYNHTCEGNEMGPTVSFRGIDNRAYYRLVPRMPRYYENWTGCGNTLDCAHPQVVRLVMDSLRYWLEEMHVDGFRFDLAPVLGRGAGGEFDPRSPLLVAMMQDPVVSRAKLVAEPWDVGPGGFVLGAFPSPWREWNAHFRDGVRRFWNGHARSLDHLGYRLAGSSDLFPHRGPLASVNFVTAHDGFTMHDLVSYRERHNEANGENNQDGTSDNASINFGIEGETRDEAVLAARLKQVKNLFVSLFLSLGVPMITAGDEFGRTQRGNNNAYTADDDVSFVDWTLADIHADLLRFVRRLAALRAETAVFRRGTFFHGMAPSAGAPKDVVWACPDGSAMEADDWQNPGDLALGMVVADAPGRLVLLLNGDGHDIEFTAPAGVPPRGVVLLATHDGPLEGESFSFPVSVPSRSALLLRC